MVPIRGIRMQRPGSTASDVANLGAVTGKTGSEAIMAGDKSVTAALRKRRAKKRREAIPTLASS
jgi:hypothetical protein